MKQIKYSLMLLVSLISAVGINFPAQAQDYNQFLLNRLPLDQLDRKICKEHNLRSEPKCQRYLVREEEESRSLSTRDEAVQAIVRAFKTCDNVTIREFMIAANAHGVSLEPNVIQRARDCGAI
jgi:hypothetical protein